MSHSDPYLLHKLVFQNDIKSLTAVLSSKSKSYTIDFKDVHGEFELPAKSDAPDLHLFSYLNREYTSPFGCYDGSASN